MYELFAIARHCQFNQDRFTPKTEAAGTLDYETRSRCAIWKDGKIDDLPTNAASGDAAEGDFPAARLKKASSRAGHCGAS
jgi:hypothetical protein